MINKTVNVLLIAIMLLFVFNTNVKSWVLQQLITAGLFNAEIKSGSESKTKASNFSFTDENGNHINISDQNGKVVFINFWASWCPPCRAEMPSMNAMYNRLKDDKRYVFVFINEDADKEKAAGFLKRNGFNIPLYKITGTIPQELYTGTLPTTLVIDKEGNLVLKHEGMADYNSETFLNQMEKLAD